MSILRFKGTGFGFCLAAISRGRAIGLRRYILAIVLTTALRGVGADIVAPGSNVGIVGGTMEDATEAIIPKAELTLSCSLPCKTQTAVASDTGGFEFRNLTLGCPVPTYIDFEWIQGVEVIDNSAQGGPVECFVDGRPAPIGGCDFCYRLRIAGADGSRTSEDRGASTRPGY